MEGNMNKRGRKPEIFSGEIKASDLCPPEMWDMVLNNLKLKDQFNCSRTCEQMQTLLKDKISLMYFQQTLPHLLPYLSKPELLRLFEVSRSLGKIVDNCVNQLIQDGSMIAKRRGREMRLQFNDTATINKFFDKVQEQRVAPVNLMMYRSVGLLAETSPGVHHKFVSTVEEFLRNYGKFILQLDFGYSSGVNWLGGCGNLLHSVLSYTPNLTNFSIYIIMAQPPQQTNPLPLPNLPHLKSLQFYRNPLQVCDMFLRQYGAQLEQLYFSSLETFNPSRYPIDAQRQQLEDITLSQLQELEMQVSSIEEVEEFRQLFATQNIQLKKLKIKFGSLEEPYAQSMVEALNEHVAALEVLNVFGQMGGSAVLANPTKFIEIPLHQLRSPNLKTVEFVQAGFPTAAMLNNMAPKLEQLFLGMEDMRPEDLTDLGVYKNLHEEPNFWNECPPTLQSVHVAVYCSTVFAGVDKKSYVYNRDVFQYMQTTQPSNRLANGN